MRRSHFAACVAAAMAAAAFAAVPASAASAPRIGVREVPLDKKYSTDQLGLRQQSARALAAPAAAPDPAVGTVRQWLAPGRLQRAALPQGLHAARRRRRRSRSGSPTTSPSPPATADADRDVDDDHRRAGRAPDQRVRRQHVPQGDEHLQHASRPRRHQRPPRPRRQRQRRRLHRRRREDRRADRQRPRRQLLHVPGGADLHRGLLLVAVQRVARPQCHDDRRVRLAAPDHARTRRTSPRPTCARAARRARTSTRARSRTSGSTSCTTTPTRSRRRG